MFWWTKHWMDQIGEHDQGYVQGAMPPHHDFLTGGDHLTGGAEP